MVQYMFIISVLLAPFAQNMFQLTFKLFLPLQAKLPVQSKPGPTCFQSLPGHQLMPGFLAGNLCQIEDILWGLAGAIFLPTPQHIQSSSYRIRFLSFLAAQTFETSLPITYHSLNNLSSQNIQRFGYRK